MGRRLSELDPAFRPLAVELIAQLIEERIPVMIITTGRTQAEQNDAFVRGLSKVRHSRHQDGKAIDLCPYDVYALHGPDKLMWSVLDPVWLVMGKVGEALGLRWGGRFGEKHPGQGDGWDPGHFELVD